jgi:chloramphenicol O-acetyltransferase type A
MVKKERFSLNLALLYFSQQTANSIREFRLRMIDGRVVEFDNIEATQTLLNDDETFSFCYFPSQPTLREYNDSGLITREKYKKLHTFDVESDRIDLIYYSSIPWVSFTSFKHASRLDNCQTVPRIVFGKMFEQDGRRMMPLSVEVNHALMDGLHVGKYYTELQRSILAV